MPLSSKFLTESTGDKIVKIGHYLAKIWTKYNSLVFLAHPEYIYIPGTLCMFIGNFFIGLTVIKLLAERRY